MKKDIKYILITSIFAVMLLLLVMAASFRETQNELFIQVDNHEVEFEAHKEILDPASLVTSHSGDLVVEPSTIDLSKPGTINVTYIISLKGHFGLTAIKTENITINVVDATYPVIEFRNYHYDLTVGDTFDPNYNVYDVYDIYEGKLDYTISDDIDFTKEGEYTVTVTAEDQNGHITTAQYTVSVSKDSDIAKHYSNIPTPTNVVYEYTEEELNTIREYLPTGDYNLLMQGKGIPELAELVKEEGFSTRLLPRYLLLIRNSSYSISDAVKTVNSNEDYISPSKLDWSSFYHDIVEIADYDSLTACVNKQNKLPEDYEPEDLVDLPDNFRVWPYPMRKAAADSIIRMSKAAMAEGYGIIRAQSNYRSFSGQENLYNRYVSEDGVREADRYSARPGHSEHQTGYVTDLSGDRKDLSLFAEYSGYDWVMENAHRFGFIQRYPKDKEYITGYMYESWHFRYVGEGAATIMYDYGWTLEEYVLIFD